MTSGASGRRTATFFTPSSPMIDLRVFEDPRHLADQLSWDICDKIIHNLTFSPRVIMTASGGRSFSLTYKHLRERHAHRLDWKRVVVVQMDDYLGLGRGDTRSLAYQVDRELVRPLGMGAFITFHDDEGGLAHEPLSLDHLVSQLGGLDLALHGIGVNGHVGFNEPGSARECLTRVVELAEQTREANFSDLSQAPKWGVTLGLETLRKARCSFLLALGPAKAPPIARLLSGDTVPMLPASVILECPTARLYLDNLAYSRFGAAASIARAPAE